MVMGRKQFQPGAVTDEQWNGWDEYRKAGGKLGLTDWLDSGQPTVETERAADAYFERLTAYLDDQMRTAGLSEGEASAILDTEWGELFGGGKQIGQTTYFSKVQSFYSGLSRDEQTRLEQEATAVARQKEMLPLGQGGTSEQQVNTAYHTIASLQRQMEDSPPALQRVIAGQIQELQGFINSEKGLQGTKARIATRQEQQREAGPFTPEPEPGSTAQWFAQKYSMSPEAALQTGMRYAQHPESGEFAGLSTQERQDVAAVATERAYAPTPPVPRFEPPELEDIPQAGGPRWKQWFEQAYPSIAREFMQTPATSEEEQTWAGFFSQKLPGMPQELVRQQRQRWSEYLAQRTSEERGEFQKLGAYARGERPAAFQPSMRTVGF